MASTDQKEEEGELLPDELPTEQTLGSLSRSSTASLGVLSNLNDVLMENIPGDYSDEDIDEIGSRLAAIDESLSPLPSHEQMSVPKKESIEHLPEPEVDIELENQYNQGQAKEALLTDSDDKMVDASAEDVHEQEIISLTSIEMTEASADKHSTREERSEPSEIEQARGVNKRIYSQIENCPPVNNNTKKNTIKSSFAPRPPTLTKATKMGPPSTRNTAAFCANPSRQSKAMTNNKRVDFKSARTKSTANSSVPSSSNGSRCSTPALSEQSEQGDLNSLCSNSSTGKL